VWADVFDHYRREFTNHGWRIVPDEGEGEGEGEGGLRAEREGMYVAMYRSEDRVYFILGER
jgi:superfamily I DNA/RNA helicase